MFAQLVIGPPGCGKTTYCNGMSQFLNALNRQTIIVNLDPANDVLPYQPEINIADLITLEDVMEKYRLGPNGGMMFCMEYLEKNLDWLEEKLSQYKEHYFLFDCPGQVELYTHHESFRNIVRHLCDKIGYRITCVHLVDSYYCSTPSNYIAAVLLSLSTMLQLELPHVNVLSKIDLVQKFGSLDYNLDFYAGVQDLNHLQNVFDKSKVPEKFKKLNDILATVIHEFDLVSFLTLNVEDKETMAKLIQSIDKANGYYYTVKSAPAQLAKLDVHDIDFEYFKVAAIQEKYILDEDNGIEEFLQSNNNNDN
eukprot:TRINITY_DN4043_c0_g1_i1.p1 TRINITY_DN4043_c0_g1~~TRINITY_DN4043_c0_g1_i1.p1  ORF type:complete len:308 (+),score=62.14 TRINITY_DN4043_c0_g1_i1:6-929(+)